MKRAHDLARTVSIIVISAAASHLYVLNQGHEAEVLVQLHMAMEEGESWIVRNEIDLGALIARNIDYVFEHSRSALAIKVRYFKCMTVQMDRVRISTLIMKGQAITSPCLHRERISVRKGLSVYCPAVKASAPAGNFLESESELMIRR